MFCRKRECKWMGGLLWIFTAFLGVLLLVQAALVALLVLDHEWTLPTPWVEKTIEHILKDPYRVSVGSATLDGDGTVTLNELAVFNHLDREIVRVESVQADLYLPSVVTGQFHLQQLRARELSLYDPVGPLGESEAVCSIAALNLIRDGNFWRIDDARILCGDLTAAVSGIVPRSLSKEFKSRETAATTSDAILDRVREIQGYFQRMKDPFLRVNLDHSEAGTLARLFLTADRVDLPFNIQLEDQVRLSTSISLDQGTLHPKPIQLRADQLIYPEGYRAEKPFLQADPPDRLDDASFFGGADLLFSASHISTPRINLESPTLRVAVNRSMGLHLQGQTSLFQNPIAINGTVDPWRGEATLQAEGMLSIESLLETPELPDKIRKAVIQFPTGVYLKASADFADSEFFPEKIRYFAETEYFEIEGFSGLFASARGIIRPEQRILEAEQLVVEKDGRFLTGTYLHDFFSNDFRFQIKGGFMPMDISGWMRDWWDEIWADFVITETPYVDLDMVGNWNHHAVRDIFGGLRFRNLIFQNMKIDRGYARLRNLPYFFELSDLHAFRPEGQASGSLGILLDPNTRETSLKLYDFQSSFRLEKVSPLFGDQIAQNLKALDLTRPPQLTIKGKIFYPERAEPSPKNLLLVQASTDAPLTYENVQLENLELTALYADQILRLKPIRFGLGGGTGEGWLIRRPEGSPSGLSSLQLTFRDGTPSEVVAAIPVLTEKVGERFSELETPDSRDHSLDFSIECSGDPDQPETLVGVGSLDLRTPNLANLRLLGILSRISEELPLPVTLGSFQFERATTSFLLNRGLVEFPDLTLYSPSSHILAEGQYRMNDQTLDFNARMQLLGQVRFPFLSQLGSLLSPIGKVFEFRIYGPLDNLNWRLYLDPRSW